MSPVRRDLNPYRAGGLRIPAVQVAAQLWAQPNKIIVEM
jgi:hypothetical protein